MSDVPPPDPEPIQHRRRRSTVWKRTPQAVKLAVGGCVVLVVLAVFLFRHHHVKEVATTETTGKIFDRLAAKLPKADIVLSHSSVNLKTRCIEGVATNLSANSYTNIEITFFILSSDETSSELRVVNIASLPPHGNAKFSTTRLADNSGAWSVREIKGTPVPASTVAGKNFPPGPVR